MKGTHLVASSGCHSERIHSSSACMQISRLFSRVWALCDLVIPDEVFLRTDFDPCLALDFTPATIDPLSSRLPSPVRSEADSSLDER